MRLYELINPDTVSTWPLWARIVYGRVSKDKPTYLRQISGGKFIFDEIFGISCTEHRFEEGYYFTLDLLRRDSPESSPETTYFIIRQEHSDYVDFIEDSNRSVVLKVEIPKKGRVVEDLATSTLLMVISKIRQKGGLVTVRLKHLPPGSILTGWLQSIEHEDTTATLNKDPLYSIYVTTESGGRRRISKSEKSLGDLVLKKEDFLYGGKPVYVLTDED